MRLCIIGNSHIACLKEGWRIVGPEAGRFRATFFGAQRLTLKDIELRDGVLVFDADRLNNGFVSTGGRHRIVVGNEHAFLIVGLGLACLHAATIYASHRTTEHLRGDEFPVSESCLAQAFHDMMKGSVAFRLARMLRTRTAAPIFLLPAPQPNTLVERVTDIGDIWKTPELRSAVFQKFSDALVRAAAPTGFTLLPQPEETLLDGLTRDEYANLDRPGDYLHANRAYGALILRQVLPLMRPKPAKEKPARRPNLRVVVSNSPEPARA